MNMSDSTTNVVGTAPVDEDDGRGKIELIAAILLGLAGLLTAYAAYYGGLAGGDAVKGYSEATISRNEANSFYSDYGTKLAQDTNVFLQYQILVEQGNDEVADVVRDRLFSPELEAAYAVWNELTGDDDVPTPMDTEAYVVLCGGRRPASDLDVEVGGDDALGRRVLDAMAVTP